MRDRPEIADTPQKLSTLVDFYRGKYKSMGWKEEDARSKENYFEAKFREAQVGGSGLKHKNVTEPLNYLSAGLIQRTDKLFHAEVKGPICTKQRRRVLN